MKIILNPADFETVVDGKSVRLFSLKNKNGLEAAITNYGGKVVSLIVPDRNGSRADMVLGFSCIDDYISSEPYFGALIGRYGNRIANGKFSINGEAYQLATNNGKNHLHGGVKGFNAVVWDAKQLDDQTMELRYFSKDMEEGYPGNLHVKVIYALTDGNEFRISYEAITDKTTVVNLTHHSFFNLSGETNTSINDHLLMINADHYTPVNDGRIPTGEIATVEGTPFDFRKAKPIKRDLHVKNEQLEKGTGYDHNFVLINNIVDANGLSLAARVSEPITGRVMEVWTSEPGMQFYGGNFLKANEGKPYKPYSSRTAFCFETQHYPDSPNKPHFPSVILEPGETYRSVCAYKFLS